MKRKILFRADGNNKIGLGHLYRCLAIADRIKDEFDTLLAIQAPSNEVSIEASKYTTVISLPKNENHRADAEYLAQKVIPSIQPVIILLDGYDFDAAYQRIIKQSSGAKLVCINDGQDFGPDADVVINHADSINLDTFNTNSHTKIYTGSQYSLLRKPFIEQGRTGREIRNIEHLFICFGGADTSRTTLKVLHSALAAHNFKQISIVAGSNYLQDEEFNKIVAKGTEINSFYNLGVGEMIGLMKTCELAIVPASTIALECRMCGMMMITGTTADNQQLIYNGLKLLPFVNGVGNFLTISGAELTSQIKNTVANFKGYIFPPVLTSADPVLNLFKSLV